MATWLSMIATISFGGFLAACGSNGPTGGPTQTAPTNGTPNAIATAGGGNAPADPCSLVTTAEAAVLVGTPVKTLPHPLSNNRESCTYSPADTAALQTAGTLVAGLFTAATPSTWQQVVQTYTRSSAGTPINGLGDAALYGTVTEPGGSTAYVAVLHGTFVLFVELASFSANPPAVSQNQLVDLARTALGRI